MDKKQVLINTALNLFVQNGFHATPTSKIAKDAGIANGTLFYFFPTKEELIKAVYLDVKTKMSKYMFDSITPNENLYVTLELYYKAILIWAQKNKIEFHYIEQFKTSPYIHQLTELELENNVKPFLDLLEKGITDKQIKKLDVEIIYTLISGHIFSVNQYLLSKKLSKPKQEKVIQETFELLWEMIRFH